MFVEATLSLLKLGEVPLDIDSTQRMLIEAQQEGMEEEEIKQSASQALGLLSQLLSSK